MKIAFIVGQFPVASKTFILNQITGLIDRGHTVDIYAESPKTQTVLHVDLEKYQLRNSIFYDLPLSSLFIKRQVQKLQVLNKCTLIDPKATLNLLNIFKFGKQAISLSHLCLAAPAIYNNKKDYDIIHCHFGPNGLKGLLLKQLQVLRGKLITTFHGFDVSKQIQLYGEDYYQPLWTHGDYFLPVSSYWKNKIIELGCDKNKVSIHRMGIDCSRFTFTPRSLQANKKVRFVSTCRLVEKKGIEYSIRAIARLAKIYPFVNYTIVGNGIQYNYLKDLIREFNVGEHIHLLGWKTQHEIIEILGNSDILIAPSVTSNTGDKEGIPVSIMEAMAMGMPIVSTIHSGIPELVRDSESGFLVPERDVDALFLKLEYLVENPEKWVEFGMTGRKHVEQYFNINTLNDQLVRIYEKLSSTTASCNHPSFITLKEG